MEIIVALLIVFGRICDVSFGTLRTIFLVNNHFFASLFCGFIECAIWLYVSANVVTNLTNPLYGFAYILGYTLGTGVGMIIDRKLAIGERLFEIFTTNPKRILNFLQDSGIDYHFSLSSTPIQRISCKLQRRQIDFLKKEIKLFDVNAYFSISSLG